MKKTVIFGLALFFVLSACQRKTEPPAPAGLDTQKILASDNILGFAALANPAATLSNLEKLAALFGPVPPGMLQGFVIQGLLSLGFKDTSVVDLTGPAAAIFLDPKKFSQPLALIVSVKGEDEVLKALQPAWKHQGVKEKVHQLSREQVDNYGVFAGGEQKKVTQNMYLAFSGKQAIAAPAAEVVTQVLPLAGMFSRAGGSDLKGALSLVRLRQLYAQEIELARQQMNVELERDILTSNPAGSPALLRVTQKMAGWMFSLFEQIDQAEFSLTANEKLAAITCDLQPAAGSTFARLLAAQKKTPLKLLSALPENHPLVVAMNLQWDEFKPALEEFTREIMEAMLKTKSSEEFTGLMKEIWQVLGDEIVMSEQIGGGLEVVEAFSVKDEKRARELFNKAFALLGKYLKDMDFGQMGFELTAPQPAGKIGEAEVEMFEMKFSIKGDDPQSQAMARAMKAVYGGDSLKMAMALSRGALFFALSPEPVKLLEKSLQSAASARGGFAGSAALQSAAGEFIEKSGGFMFLSVSSFMRQSAQMAMAGQGGKSAVAVTPSTSGLYFGACGENGKLQLVFRAPAEHLKEIGEALKGLMGGAMQ
jgi:hypothetical protein